MAKWYAATGKLTYSDNGWLVLNAHKSIVFYYKFWVEKFIWKKISTPLHGAHCTVINGNFENKTNHKLWNAHQGALIRFEYSSVIETNGQYYWLPVKCDRLKEIRMGLGLRPLPLWPLHLTIGFCDN